MIPTLATERLTLRAPAAADFESYAAFYASQRSIWEDGPLSRTAAWAEFAASAGGWVLRGFGAFSLVERASGRYLGEVGLYQPAHYPEPEIGSILMAEAEGRGFATEAARAVRAGPTRRSASARSSATSPPATAARSASPSGSAPSSTARRRPAIPTPSSTATRARGRCMIAPLIETARLTLRPYRLSDWERFAAFYESDAARYVGGPLPRPRTWNGFAADVGSWELFGFGYWAIEETATGACVGQVGLSHPPHFPEREIGWIVYPEFQRRGFATEAALAARAYAYGIAGWTTAVSYIDRDNARSIALALRIGCTEDRGAARLDPEDLVFRHPAPGARP